MELRAPQSCHSCAGTLCQDPGLLSCGSDSFGVNSAIVHVISGSTSIINANGGDVAPSGNPFTIIVSEEILLKVCITLKFILESRIRHKEFIKWVAWRRMMWYLFTVTTVFQLQELVRKFEDIVTRLLVTHCFMYKEHTYRLKERKERGLTKWKPNVGERPGGFSLVKISLVQSIGVMLYKPLFCSHNTVLAPGPQHHTF